jgi:hypothetical protein
LLLPFDYAQGRAVRARFERLKAKALGYLEAKTATTTTKQKQILRLRRRMTTKGKGNSNNNDNAKGQRQRQRQRQRQMRGFFPFDKLRARMTGSLG